MSMMSSVLGSRADSNVNDRKIVAKKYTDLNIQENNGRIDEIEKELEEMDSPDSKRDVLDEAHDLVDDDDMISQYSATISVLNDNHGVKMIDKELQKEEEFYKMTLKNSLKLIDDSKDIQVFNGPLEQPFENLDVTMQKQLGAGAQAEVF